MGFHESHILLDNAEDHKKRCSQDDYISEQSHTFTTDCTEKTSRILLLTSADDYSMSKIFEIVLFF